MTDNQLERRYNILTKLMEDKRDNYTVNLDNTYIQIRNNTTLEGFCTDSFHSAKQWIKKDMEEVHDINIQQ